MMYSESSKHNGGANLSMYINTYVKTSFLEFFSNNKNCHLQRHSIPLIEHILRGRGGVGITSGGGTLMTHS